MLGGNSLRGAQDRNGLLAQRLAAQLGTATVRARHKRFFGGPVPLPARNVASPTALVAQRLLLQSQQVQRELSLANSIAGPGPIR